jgi:hypothetical protein
LAFDLDCFDRVGEARRGVLVGVDRLDAGIGRAAARLAMRWIAKVWGI